MAVEKVTNSPGQKPRPTRVIRQMAPSKGAGAPSRANTAPGASAADVATNQALLFHAEAARLAKSWLRGLTTGDGRDAEGDEDDDQDKAEEELEKEFLRNKDSYSETGGIGYHPPPTESTSSTTAATRGLGESATTTFLRKQLLRGRATNGSANAHFATTARPRPQTQTSGRAKGEEDPDEEESRSGVGKSKRNVKIMQPAAERGTATSAPQKGEAETGHPPEGSGALSAPAQAHGESDRVVDAPEHNSVNLLPPTPSKKRGAGSYLDELLASRAAKKQKKKNKNKGESFAESEPG